MSFDIEEAKAYLEEADWSFCREHLEEAIEEIESLRAEVKMLKHMIGGEAPQ